MIGDSDSDIQAGQAAKCKTLKLAEGELLSAIVSIVSHNNE